MLLRSTFGILAFAALLASASASIVTYRVTGIFDEATEDYAPLMGTEFVYEFSYDTETMNLGDDTTALYSILGSSVRTTMGDLDGQGGIEIDLDPQYGSLSVGALSEDDDWNIQVYGLVFPGIEPQTGALPKDFREFASKNDGIFLLTSAGTVGTFAGVGSASSSRFSVQAVPEPASVVAISTGALAVLRRRRKAA